MRAVSCTLLINDGHVAKIALPKGNDVENMTECCDAAAIFVRVTLPHLTSSTLRAKCLENMFKVIKRAMHMFHVIS